MPIPLGMSAEQAITGLAGLAVIVGYLWRIDVIKWPQRAEAKIERVAKADFERFMLEIQSRLKGIEADVRGAAEAANLAKQTATSVSELVEQGMNNLTQRFSSSLDKLDQLTTKMVDRMGQIEIDVAKASALGLAQQGAHEAFENRLQSIEASLRDKS